MPARPPLGASVQCVLFLTRVVSSEAHLLFFSPELSVVCLSVCPCCALGQDLAVLLVSCARLLENSFQSVDQIRPSPLLQE